MRMRLRVALTVKSRAPPLPAAMAWATYPSTWWRKLFSPDDDLGGWWWDAFFRLSKIVTTALHCCHAGMVIYMRDTKRDTHIETELGRGLVGGVPQKPAERTFPLLTFPSKFFPPLTFSHTHSCPFPSPFFILLLLLSSSWSATQGGRRNAQVPIWLWKLSGKKAFTSFSSWTGFPPSPFHSRHNFWNIFTKISRQCNLKTSFVELLKCKFKSPFLFNIGIWFDQWLMGSLACGPKIWIENWGSHQRP